MSSPIREAALKRQGRGSRTSGPTYARIARAHGGDEAGPGAVRAQSSRDRSSRCWTKTSARAPAQAMRILYSAIDQTVPGTGGIRARGGGGGRAGGARPRRPALVTPGDGTPAIRGVRWVAMAPPLGASAPALARVGAIARSRARCGPTRSSSGTTTSAAKRSALAAVGAVAMLEVNAPVIDHPGLAEGDPRPRSARQPMRRWRERVCGCRGRDRDAERGDRCRLTDSARRSSVLEWGADTDRFHPARDGPRPSLGRHARSRSSPARSVPGTARSIWSKAIRVLRERGQKDIGAVFVGDGPELPRVREAAGHRHDPVHRRGPARAHAGAARGADIGVAPFDIARPRAAVARLLLVAAEDLRIHGQPACRSSRRGGSDPGARRRRPRRDSVRFRRAELTHASRWPDALVKLSDPALRHDSAPPRANARCATTAGPRTAARWNSHRRRGARGRRCLRCAEGAGLWVLIPTDAFPPVCGGSGWSTYELARGLRARGHDVDDRAAAGPEPHSGVRETEYDGFRIRQFGAPAPNLPYVRNYYKSEKLTQSLAAYLSSLLAAERFDIVHAQHVMTTMAAIDAARAAGVPAVATVRDYWPVCYWSDLLHTRDGLALCPECTAANMRVCISRAPAPLWPLALPMIPYMRSNLAAKRAGLARGRRHHRRQPADRRGPARARARAGARRGSR